MAVTFSEEKLDEKKLEISDLNLKKRMRRVTPLIQKDDDLYTFDVEKLRNASFMWDPKNLQLIDKTQYREVSVTNTYFDCAHYSMFKPSLAEVMAQLPKDDSIVAFYLDDNVPVTVLHEGEGHVVPCHWLAKA